MSYGLEPGKNSSPNSASDSASESASDSESNSSSSSESEVPLMRPIFIKKNPIKKINAKKDSSSSVLAKAEHINSIESKTVEKLQFDDSDDSDDVDPEEEYKQWRLRELFRKKRDADLRARIEAEKEDALRRKRGYNEGNESEDGGSDEPRFRSKSPSKSVKIGAFFVENIYQKLLKRDYKDLEGQEDHSRPTKYKLN